MFPKSDAKIEIIITATNLIRIKYPLCSLNYHLSGANVANFIPISHIYDEMMVVLFTEKVTVINLKSSC